MTSGNLKKAFWMGFGSFRIDFVIDYQNIAPFIRFSSDFEAFHRNLKTSKWPSVAASCNGVTSFPGPDGFVSPILLKRKKTQISNTFSRCPKRHLPIFKNILYNFQASRSGR